MNGMFCKCCGVGKRSKHIGVGNWSVPCRPLFSIRAALLKQGQGNKCQTLWVKFESPVVQFSNLMINLNVLLTNFQKCLIKNIIKMSHQNDSSKCLIKLSHQNFSHTLIYSYIPTFLHSYIHTCIHSYIPKFLHSYIPEFLNFWNPEFLHSYITRFLDSYIPTFLDS